MDYKFKKANSTVCPAVIDTTSSAAGIYYRKNIERIEIEDEFTQEKRIEFNYDEIFLPLEFKFNIQDTEIYAAKIEEILQKLNVEFEQKKMQKHLENAIKAKEARYNQEFSIIIQNKECVFDTSAETQSDLLTAFAVCAQGETYDGWVTNNGVELDLTLEDVTLIAATFKELSNVYSGWNEYKALIDKAETIEELEAIEINYTKS